VETNESLPLSPRDLLVLLVLTDGPLHGYGIVKAVEERSGAAVLLDPANLYRTLRRMRRDGWVEEMEETDPEDARRRNFRLTPDGRRVVAAEVDRLERVLAWARPIGTGEA
jgi:DNA-binding PadR family transcriptional regulator